MKFFFPLCFAPRLRPKCLKTNLWSTRIFQKKDRNLLRFNIFILKDIEMVAHIKFIIPILGRKDPKLIYHIYSVRWQSCRSVKIYVLFWHHSSNDPYLLSYTHAATKIYIVHNYVNFVMRNSLRCLFFQNSKTPSPIVTFSKYWMKLKTRWFIPNNYLYKVRLSISVDFKLRIYFKNIVIASSSSRFLREKQLNWFSKCVIE